MQHQSPSMLLPMLALLLLLGAASGSRRQRDVSCPQLKLTDVCPEARANFHFSDGCNTVMCDGRGSGITTMRFCEGPATPRQRLGCMERASAVFARLGEFTCPNLASSKVCPGRREDYGFNDGCNGVQCGSNGAATLKWCPRGDPEGAYCKFMESLIDEEAVPVDSKRSGTPEEQQEQEPSQYTCPQLAGSAVCRSGMNGFSYNDGCNDIRCHGHRLASSTFMFCPAAEKDDQRAQEYCREAARKMAAKRKASKSHSECLKPEEACANGVKSYYDGCNNCFCLRDGGAGCGRRACREFFGTDEEFAEECRRRGAGPTGSHH